METRHVDASRKIKPGSLGRTTQHFCEIVKSLMKTLPYGAGVPCQKWATYVRYVKLYCKVVFLGFIFLPTKRMKMLCIGTTVWSVMFGYKTAIKVYRCTIEISMGQHLHLLDSLMQIHS